MTNEKKYEENLKNWEWIKNLTREESDELKLTHWRPSRYGLFKCKHCGEETIKRPSTYNNTLFKKCECRIQNQTYKENMMRWNVKEQINREEKRDLGIATTEICYRFNCVFCGEETIKSKHYMSKHEVICECQKDEKLLIPKNDIHRDNLENWEFVRIMTIEEKRTLYNFSKESIKTSAHLYKCRDCGDERICIAQKFRNQKQFCQNGCHGNCLMSSHPELLYLLANKEEDKLLKPHSLKIVKFKCPDCKTIFDKPLNSIHRFSCPACSDGVSYPEKFVRNVFNQLGVDYVYQFSIPSIERGTKRYDFYIPSLNTVIELHGSQHYRDWTFSSATITQENDNFKKKLALDYGITNYIIINCSKSEKEFMKNNIIKMMADVLKLDGVDWNEAHKNAISSICGRAIGLYNQGKTVSEIMEELNLARGVVIRYLRRGEEAGLCTYIPRRKAIS